jgi:hypothetical protein
MLIKTSQVSRFVVNTFRRMNPTVRFEPYLCLNEQYVLYCNYCRKNYQDQLVRNYLELRTIKYDLFDSLLVYYIIKNVEANFTRCKVLTKTNIK